MKKTIYLLIIISLLIGMVSCESNDSDNNVLSKVYASEKSNDVNSANNSFAFDIFKEINNNETNKNVFISPYSIQSVMSMLYNGANGNTQEELSKTLYYKGIDDETLNNGQMYLRERLESIDNNIELDINNSLWIRDGFNVEPTYIDLSKQIFDSYVTEIDMSKSTAADTINSWISKATNGMIDKMIDSPIDPDVIMYLINTIYFEGKWTTPFDTENTHQETFTNNDGTTSMIDMMFIKSEFKYGENNDEKIIEIPYGDGEVSMYCILPKEGTDIDKYINNLDAKKWEQLRYTTLKDNTEEVLLTLPKFKVEYGIKNINDELQNLGIKEAFTGSADFSAIANNIYLSRVLHKAVIEVDESGTKAAASTVGEMKFTAIMLPTTFTANRPFIYIISDQTDGSILFIGKNSTF